MRVKLLLALANCTALSCAAAVMRASGALLQSLKSRELSSSHLRVRARRGLVPPEKAGREACSCSFGDQKPIANYEKKRKQSTQNVIVAMEVPPAR